MGFDGWWGLPEWMGFIHSRSCCWGCWEYSFLASNPATVHRRDGPYCPSCGYSKPQVKLTSALTFLGWSASAFYYPLN